MNAIIYDRNRHLHVRTLSWGQDDDGNQIASAIVRDALQGTYLLRFVSGRDGTKPEDTMEVLDTATWTGAPSRIRSIIERDLIA